MGDRVNRIPRDDFVAAWNASGSLAEAAERVRLLTAGPAPRWAVLARAQALRRDGISMKPLPPTAATASVVG